MEGDIMSANSTKRRGLYALLGLIAMVLLAFASPANAEGGLTGGATPSCSKDGQMTVAVTVGGLPEGAATTATVYVNGNAVDKHEFLKDGNWTSGLVNAVPGDKVFVGYTGLKGVPIEVVGCSEPTPTPTVTPTETPKPTPTPTVTITETPPPVTETPEPGKTVVVTPAPVVREVVVPTSSTRTGKMSGGSMVLVIAGALLIGGLFVLKFNRRRQARQH